MSHDELNSPALVDRLKSGDNQAFVDLVTRLGPKLCAILSRQLSIGREDAQEIVSDAFLKAYNKISEFDCNGKAKLTTWITRIALNRAKDFLRRERTQFHTKAHVIPTEASADEAHSALDIQARSDWFRLTTEGRGQAGRNAHELDAICNVLSRMDEKDSDILRQRLIFSYEQIAKTENEPVGRLRIRHKRAFERLREEVDKEMNI